MIRPKHPSFEYSEDEINLMINDIKFCKSLGIDGVVLGCLDENYNFKMEQIQLVKKKLMKLEPKNKKPNKLRFSYLQIFYKKSKQ